MSSRLDRSAELKFVVTNTLIVEDIERSVALYCDILGAKVLREAEPTFCGSAASGSPSTAAAAPPTTSLKSSPRRRAIETL